jgi:hypothetical protein
MAWYLWVLIVLALLVVGFFKLKLFGKILERKKAKEKAAEED